MSDKPKAKRVPPGFEGVRAGSTVGHFVSPEATIADLEKKAAECEQNAGKAEEPRASQLRQQAERCRAWAASLRSGQWTA